MMKPVINIMWFRRDLRLNDNAALYHALRSGYPVVPLFIFDRNILDDLPDKYDRRVEFIYQSVQQLQQALADLGSSLEVFYGFPESVFKKILEQYQVQAVFANNDYEQYAIDRDAAIGEWLNEKGVLFNTYKDQVIFEKNEVVKDDGKPYTVFTPYSKKWKQRLDEFYVKSYPAEKYLPHFYKTENKKIPSLQSMGFYSTQTAFPAKKIIGNVIKNYDRQRDFPGMEGTSRLSVHLRFGTISIRQLVQQARQLNEVYLNELIWREFYQMILWQMPHVRKGFAFKPPYDRIEWRNNEAEFDAWCKGQTGYPIVDAGMRELNATGYMHNRVRMITASFLCKHLLVDWRWGETYFAAKLLDYDFAANNGGWQWAAGSGCDAAPYFRIFNPITQQQKFDKNLSYIGKWVPELYSDEYPSPIVVHEYARNRCLEVYKKALAK